MCSCKWQTYTYLWIEEMHEIAIHYKHKCIHHLLNSSIIPDTTSKKVPKFTLSCISAFMSLGFRARNPLTWEYIMDQPLFYNKSIINPDTNLPYDRNKPPFKDMKGIHYPSFPQRTAFRTGMILRFLGWVQGRRSLSFGSSRLRSFAGPTGPLAYRKSEQIIIIRSQFLQNHMHKRYWSKPGSMVG